MMSSDDRRSTRIGLGLGVIGALSAMVYTIVYYWLYYQRLAEIYFGTYDPSDWVLIFEVTNRVYLACMIFLVSGFFALLGRRDTRLGVPFVIMFMVATVSVFLFYPILGPLAFWPTLVTNFLVWFIQGLLVWLASRTGDDSLLLKLVALLLALNPIVVYGVQQLVLLLLPATTPIDVIMQYVPFIIFRQLYYIAVCVLLLREGRRLR